MWRVLLFLARSAWELRTGLASLILVTVVATHYTYDVLASFYPDPSSVAGAIFYILRGFEGTILYCAVWALTPWKPPHARLAVSFGCAWGAIESLQTSVCRLAIGIENSFDPQPYKGLCDLVTGWPIYMMTLLLVLLVFTLQYTRRK